jgi:hypothetical protein
LEIPYLNEKMKEFEEVATARNSGALDQDEE